MENINLQASKVLNLFVKISLVYPILCVFLYLLFSNASNYLFSALIITSAISFTLLLSIAYDIHIINQMRNTKLNWHHVDQKLIFSTKIKIYSVLASTTACLIIF